MGTTTKAPAIYAAMGKLQKLMGEHGIKKGGRRADGSFEKASLGQGRDFEYRGIETLMNSLIDPLNEVGIVIVPAVEEHTTQVFEGDKGPQVLTTLVVSYECTSTEDGSSIKGSGIGYAISGLGKVSFNPGIAASYAYRVFVEKWLDIPTEGATNDPEAVMTREAREAERVLDLPKPKQQIAPENDRKTQPPPPPRELTEAELGIPHIDFDPTFIYPGSWRPNQWGGREMYPSPDVILAQFITEITNILRKLIREGKGTGVAAENTRWAAARARAVQTQKLEEQLAKVAMNKDGSPG